MTGVSKLKLGAAGALALLTVAAAPPAKPKALAVTSPGLWEISGQPGAAAPRRMCVRDVASLAQIEQRGAQCTRVVIRDLPTKAEIHYTCTGGGFGQSKIELITPRSLRIETQGIAASAPFHYVFQARRVGECPVH
jgi:hypothetical protein